MSEDFKCQADDTAKGDVVSADASSIECGAEAFKPDWELTTPEQLSVALTLAFARCAPEVWRETGATDEELHAVSEDVLRQLRQRQLEEATPDDEDRGLVWPAPKIVRRGRVVWDDAQPAQRPIEEPQQSEGDERSPQALHQPDTQGDPHV
jgi:hypothetical protein